MDKAEEKLIINRLVFELTMADGFAFDVEILLDRLCTVLGEYPELPVGRIGAIVLRGPNGKFFQVAQHGIPSAWETDHEWDSGAFSKHRVVSDRILVAHLPIPTMGSNGIAIETTRVVLLPLKDNQHEIGYAVLGTRGENELEPIQLEFLADLARPLSSLINRALTLETLNVREFELEEARANAIRSLGVASEYRDNETGWHIMRMTNIAQSIAKALGLSERLRELLYIAAPMHDVGKIGIPDSILRKPGELSDDEFETMKTHTVIGVTILTGNDELIAAARDIAGCHHEHWDGGGYPNGLKGERIPILARICAVADVFDALTSSRPYKEPWPIEEAVAWIVSKGGSHFDPAVVDAFRKAIPEILRIRELYRDDIIDPKKELSLPPLERPAQQWVAWDDSLSVGIDTIDEHHRYLFDLLNDLFDVVKNKRGARQVARVLKALETYAKVHFQAEEQMMAHYGFSGLDRQERQHREFTVRLAEFYQELHTNPLITQIDVLAYLRNWLIQHIRKEDARLRLLTEG